MSRIHFHGPVILAVLIVLYSGRIHAAELKWRLKDEGSETLRAVAISMDGKLLAQDDGKAIRIWDLETGKALRSWKNSRSSHGSHDFALSPDGKRLAFASTSLYHGDILVFDATNGEQLWKRTDATSSSWLQLTFSPDGKQVVSTGNFIVSSKDEETLLRVWDAKDGSLVRELKGGTIWRNLPIPFAPDSKTVVALSKFDRLIFWDTVTGRADPEVCVAEVGWKDAGRAYENHIEEYAFAPNGKILAIRTNTSLFLWDRSTAKQVRELSDRKNDGARVQFSADGLSVLGFTQDRGLVSWDVKTGVAKTLLKIDDSGSVAFSSDRKILVSGFDVYQISK